MNNNIKIFDKEYECIEYCDTYNRIKYSEQYPDVYVFSQFKYIDLNDMIDDIKIIGERLYRVGDTIWLGVRVMDNSTKQEIDTNILFLDKLYFDTKKRKQMINVLLNG